jgi:hypothetical protein
MAKLLIDIFFLTSEKMSMNQGVVGSIHASRTLKGKPATEVAGFFLGWPYFVIAIAHKCQMLFWLLNE